MATRTKREQQEDTPAEMQETRSTAHESNGRDASGRGWHGNPEGHAAAGRKGGQTVSQNKEHMASIGRRGGQAVSRDRQHMASIGRKGGQARGDKDEAAVAADSR